MSLAVAGLVKGASPQSIPAATAIVQARLMITPNSWFLGPGPCLPQLDPTRQWPAAVASNLSSPLAIHCERWCGLTRAEVGAP